MEMEWEMEWEMEREMEWEMEWKWWRWRWRWSCQHGRMAARHRDTTSRHDLPRVPLCSLTHIQCHAHTYTHAFRVALPVCASLTHAHTQVVYSASATSGANARGGGGGAAAAAAALPPPPPQSTPQGRRSSGGTGGTGGGGGGGGGGGTGVAMAPDTGAYGSAAGVLRRWRWWGWWWAWWW